MSLVLIKECMSARPRLDSCSPGAARCSRSLSGRGGHVTIPRGPRPGAGGGEPSPGGRGRVGILVFQELPQNVAGGQLQLVRLQ